MKEINIKKYVAFDGTQFDNELDCYEYELGVKSDEDANITFELKKDDISAWAESNVYDRTYILTFVNDWDHDYVLSVDHDEKTYFHINTESEIELAALWLMKYRRLYYNTYKTYKDLLEIGWYEATYRGPEKINIEEIKEEYKKAIDILQDNFNDLPWNRKKEAK